MEIRVKFTMPMSSDLHNIDPNDFHSLLYYVNQDHTLSDLKMKIEINIGEQLAKSTKFVINQKVYAIGKESQTVNNCMGQKLIDLFGSNQTNSITVIDHKTSNLISDAFMIQKERAKLKLKQQQSQETQLQQPSVRPYDMKHYEQKLSQKSDSSSINQVDQNTSLITPELIALATGAEKPALPPGFFLRERLNNLIQMLENELINTAALDLRNSVSFDQRSGIFRRHENDESNSQVEEMVQQVERQSSLQEQPQILHFDQELRTPPRQIHNRGRVYSYEEGLGQNQDQQQFNQGYLLNQINTQANPEKVSMLKEMGFNDDQAKQALTRFKNNLDQAMNYLLTVGCDDEQLSDHSTQLSQTSSQNSNQPLSNPSADQISIQNSMNSSSSQQRPNEDYISQLMDMGFPRDDVIQALRLSRNDYELACEYLLNTDTKYDEDQSSQNFMQNYPSQDQIFSQAQLQNEARSDQVQNQLQVIGQQMQRQPSQFSQIRSNLMILDDQNDDFEDGEIQMSDHYNDEYYNQIDDNQDYIDQEGYDAQSLNLYDQENDLNDDRDLQ